MTKNLISSLIAVIVLVMPAAVSAHVVVTPKAVKVAENVSFSVSVPNERSAAVTELKLRIPKGVQNVTPTVKPGWNIVATADTITWSSGSIPPKMRDDFTFRAQAPANATTLNWKAYQTYEDGVVVSWDQQPSVSAEGKERETSGPYSITRVINDMSPTPAPIESKDNSLPLIVSLLALVISVAAFFKQRGNRQN